VSKGLVGGGPVDDVQDPVADEQALATNTIACVIGVVWSRADTAP
jgi:hypothetical protein